jgi:hypothetical protein
MLTIQFDGMDMCACEDAYERVAHLFKRKIRVRTQAKSETGQCSCRSLHNNTHLMKPDREQPVNTNPQKVNKIPQLQHLRGLNAAALT